MTNRRAILHFAIATALVAALPLPAFAQDGFPASIEHELGTVTLDAPAKRIVLVSEEFIETGLAMGVAPVAVGIWRSEVPDGPYAKLPYLDQPLLGEPVGFDAFEPNYEALLALSPDLIVYHMSAEEDRAEIYDHLAQIAPTVAFIGTEPGSWKRVALALGQATGQGALADKLIAYFDAEAAGLVSQMQPIAAAHPTVTAIFAFGENSGYFDERFDIASNLTRLGFTLTSPLGDDIAASGFSVASPESVSEIDADTIFVFRRSESTFDLLLSRRPQPVLEMALPPAIGHTGPFTEMLYLKTISAALEAQYPG